MIAKALKKLKSTAKLLPFNEEDKKLFKDIVFLIEANRNEQLAFWRDHFHDPRHKNDHIKEWKEVSMGHGITIGTVDNRPVVVSISYAFLNGKKVMFYEGVSQLVDHQMIEDWLMRYAENIKYDNGTRWAHCNSSNFHHCLHFVKDQ